MPVSIPWDVAGPGAVALLLGGSLLALCLLTLLIALIEATAMILLRWGDFRQAMTASVLMNAVSTALGGALLVLFPRPPLWGLGVAWALSVLVEGGVLSLLRRGMGQQNWLAALAANIASYLIIILPAYYYGIRSAIA